LLIADLFSSSVAAVYALSAGKNAMLGLGTLQTWFSISLTENDHRDIGVRPAFKIVAAASGDARKRIRAWAASGCRALLVSAAEKETSG
jgi:hypothetical protein